MALKSLKKLKKKNFDNNILIRTLISLDNLRCSKCHLAINLVNFAGHKTWPKLRFNNLSRNKAFTFRVINCNRIDFSMKLVLELCFGLKRREKKIHSLKMS